MKIALAVSFFGVLAFVLGVVAENKKVIFSPFSVCFDKTMTQSFPLSVFRNEVLS